MRTGFVRLIAILAFTLLIISACSHNKPLKEEQDGYQLPVSSRTSYTVLNLPAWLVFAPEGETAIGIAPDTGKKKPLPELVAKSMAAYSLVKNLGNYVLDKPALLKTITENNPELKSLNISAVITPDADLLSKGTNQLSILAEASFEGYKLYLFSAGKPEFNADIIRISADRTPNWAKSQVTYEEGDMVNVTGTGDSKDLAEAWKAAQDNALAKLANYRLLNALPQIKIADTEAKKLALMDIVASPANATFTKTWFFQKVVNSVPSYHAFIMLKAPIDSQN